MVPLPRSVATLVAKLGVVKLGRTVFRYRSMNGCFFLMANIGVYRYTYIIYTYIYMCTIHGSFGFVQFLFVQKAVQRKVVGCFLFANHV